MLVLSTPTPIPEPTPEMQGHADTLLSYIGPDARAFEIQTQDDLEQAAELLNDIKRRTQELDQHEKYMTGPFREGIARIVALFKPAKQAAADARSLWQAKILESNKRRAEEATRALLEAQAAVAAQDRPAAALALAKVQPVEKVQGLQVRKRWTFRVINQGLLPAAYLMPNEAAIKETMRAALAAGEAPVIPGVKFEQEESLAATG